LVQRSRGTADAIGPRLPSRFELPAAAAWGEIEEFVVVDPPRRRPEPVAERDRVRENHVDRSERVAARPPARPPEADERIAPPDPVLDEPTPTRDAPRAEPRLREVTTIIREVVKQTAISALAGPENVPERGQPAHERVAHAPVIIQAERAPLTPEKFAVPIEEDRPAPHLPRVQVHIGRIEVKVPPGPPPRTTPAPRPTPPRLALSLHDYLARRRRS
jgi:hypothetical protein